MKPLSLTVPAVFANRNLLTGYCVATVSRLRIFSTSTVPPSGCRRCAVMPDGGLAPLTEPCGPLSAASPNN
jgi:hypothetical protein